MDKISAKIDEKKKQEAETERTKKPELVLKKEEFKKRIRVFKDKIDEVYKEWDDKWDVYYD
jgi:hypothetical protein